LTEMYDIDAELFLLWFNTMGIQLTYPQKKEIILHCQASPGITNCALTGWADERFSTSVAEMTVSRILKNQALLAGRGKERPEAKRVRKSVSPVVEEATYAWSLMMQEKSATASDDILCGTAKRFYADLPRDPDVKELQFSRGWVAGSKKRHGFRGFTRHGEAASVGVSVDTQILIERIKEEVATYGPADVFNMDCFSGQFKFYIVLFI
jgi:hypothetical protein